MDNSDSSDVRDRISARFDSESEDSTESGNEGNSKNESSSMSSKNSGASKSSMKERKSKNVKKDWNATTIYLPDELNRDLSTVYKRTDLDLSETSDRSLKKTRHYYPLVIALGLERLESMDTNEVMEALDNLSI